MGKTAFVLNIAEYVALHSNSTIALFSLEMSKEQLVKRMLAMNSMVDSQKTVQVTLKMMTGTSLSEVCVR